MSDREPVAASGDVDRDRARADARDAAADDRERLADEREELADERAGLADLRDSLADQGVSSPEFFGPGSYWSYATSWLFNQASWTSCGVRYPSPE